VALETFLLDAFGMFTEHLCPLFMVLAVSSLCMSRLALEISEVFVAQLNLYLINSELHCSFHYI
jgi:hypothetical protein